MVVVAAILPGGDLLDEVELVGDPAIETLTRQHAELGFGHIEPTAVFRLIPAWLSADQDTTIAAAPKSAAAMVAVETLYAVLRRRRITPNPNRAAPRRAMEAGSGAGVIGTPAIARSSMASPESNAKSFAFVTPNSTK